MKLTGWWHPNKQSPQFRLWAFLSSFTLQLFTTAYKIATTSCTSNADMSVYYSQLSTQFQLRLAFFGWASIFTSSLFISQRMNSAQLNFLSSIWSAKYLCFVSGVSWCSLTCLLRMLFNTPPKIDKKCLQLRLFWLFHSPWLWFCRRFAWESLISTLITWSHSLI